MDLGVHLPLIGFSNAPWTLEGLLRLTATAEELGFSALAQNDHFLYSRPWLDGPVALSAVLSATSRMDLFTTVALPVLRGPVPTAKTIAAIDLLSGGRMHVAVGPGSSAADYRAVGVPFEERWLRADESVAALRALLNQGSPEFTGKFYSTAGVKLEPYPAQQPGPPIWIGSWGSEAGLKRTARIGDGWLASAYNTTPDLFARGLQRLNELLLLQGKSPENFPNAISTMVCYFTDDRAKADRMLSEQIGPALGRPPEELRDRFLVGPADECLKKLEAYRDAGARLIFLWPAADEIAQLEFIHDRIAPYIA